MTRTRPSALTTSTACLLLVGYAFSASATPLLYSNELDFLSKVSELGLTVQTADFEADPAGTLVGSGSTVQGVTFSNFALRSGPGLIIDNAYAAKSGTNYLGEQAPGNGNQITGGSEFDMSFAPSKAIGLSIITAETVGSTLFDGDVRLVLPGGATVGLNTLDLQETLGDGSQVFFLGIVDPSQTFSTAGIRYASGAVDAMFYNIDDVQTAPVPEPGSFALLLGALVCGALTVRRVGRCSVGKASE